MLVISPEKSFRARTELEFLGYIIIRGNQNGQRPNGSYPGLENPIMAKRPPIVSWV
jgi:hypothetical protein